MTFGAVTIQGDNPVATLLVAAGEGPVQVVNNDSNNTLYLGDNPSIASTDQKVTPLGPLTPVSFDGSADIYGVAAKGQTVQVLLYPSAVGWAPSASQIIGQLTLSTLPVLIADAVQSAGVPPIDIPATLYVIFNQDVPADGTFSTGHINVSRYQSYDMVLKVANSHNNADTIPYMRFTFKWSLAADNYDPIHVEDWIVPVTPFNFVYSYTNYGAGPCYSDTLDIVATSYDTVINSFTIGLFGSYRTRLRSIMRGVYNFNSDGTLNETAGLGSDAILASMSGTNLAPGSSSSSQLVNLWHGNADLYLTSSIAAIDCLECHIQPQPSGSIPDFPDIVLTMDGESSFTSLRNILLPRRVCTMFFKNNGPITIPSYSATLVAEGVSE